MFIEFKNFKIYKDLYGKPFKRDYTATVVFLKQILLTFGGRCNHFFIPLKIYRLPSLNIFFQFLLTKFSKSEVFARI